MVNLDELNNTLFDLYDEAKLLRLRPPILDVIEEVINKVIPTVFEAREKAGATR